MLYLELLTEQHEKDCIRMVSTGTCAVFDEEALNEEIARLRKLKRLRSQAEKHNMLVREEHLKELGVKYTVKPLVKKKC